MVSSRQVTISSFHRDAWVEIDLSAIEQNVANVRSWLKVREKPARLMAVVKSDAYGHGAPQIADLLSASGADFLGVASVDEGCQLRSSSIKAPVLILSPTPFWAIENALEDNLDLTFASLAQVKDINKIAARRGVQARIHLKVDSGMHRLGVAKEAVPTLLNEISQLPNVKLVSVFSHLACAGERETTLRQLDVFNDVLNEIRAQERQVMAHIASSEAARFFPETHLDMVRIGIYLYGLEGREVSNTLVPAMSVKARINHINMVKAGDAVGYNLTWQATRDSRLACVPIGYADGVDRRLSNRIEGILLGNRVAQVGLISMDQMLFDISDVPEAQDGDVITLIGKEGTVAKTNSASSEPCLHLASWAEMLDTITYELACRLRTRLPRIYTRHHGSSAKQSPYELPSARDILSSESPEVTT